MRRRLLSLALGTAVTLTTAPQLASPALAVPPPATPVEIGAPVPEFAHDTTTGFAGFTTGGGALAQTFVADRSAAVTSVSMPRYTQPLTLTIYAADRFSTTAGPGLNPVSDSVFFAGSPLATATFTTPGSGGGSDATLHTETFDQTVNLIEGTTYWLLERTLLGEAVGFKNWGSTTGQLIMANGTALSGELSLRLNSDPNEERKPVGVTLTGDGGAGGWFTGPVTATYTCWSGVAACPSTATISVDGDNALSGTVDDNGADFAWLHHVKVDATPPTILGIAEPHGSGFRVTWSCTDQTSGIAECPAPTYASGIGSDTVATAVATDNAGNTATGTVSGLVGTKHAPRLTIKGVTPNKIYKHGTKLTPSCTATDTRNDLRKRIDAPTVSCTGKTSSHRNKDGSVTWTYTATAVDAHPLGGTTTKSVKWRVAAKPKATLLVSGLPARTKNGHAVIDHRKTYDLSFVFRDANGKKLKGKPTWLHSVETNKAGTKGKPTKKAAAQFRRVGGVWTKTFTPGYDYKGEYRKFGVIAPDGTRHYVVIYVK